MLSIDISAGRVDEIANEWAATPNQITDAYSKALTRTAGTLRKSIVPDLVSELGLKNGKYLRKKIKVYNRKGANRASAKIWVGTRGMHYSDFKGRPEKKGRGLQIGDDFIFGGFMGTSAFTGRREAFTRKGRESHPIRLERKEIHDRVVAYLEDNVYVDIEAIFFKNFEHEIRARTLFGIGRK